MSRLEGRQMTDYATDWRAAGACLSADPDLFYPVATGTVAVVQIRKAQQICAGCQVRHECLDFAVRTGEAHGVWGGTTPEERTRFRRRRARRARLGWHDAPAARAS
jgi:WhiB family transcriptional regulator, redox-sensing transcriptional regulator